MLIHIHPRYSFRLHRYKNQYLYLKSALYGLLLTISSFTISAILHFNFHSDIESFISFLGISINNENRYAAFVLLTSILSVFSPIIYTGLDFLRLFIKLRTITISNINAYYLFKLFKDSPLDNLLSWATLGQEKYDRLVRIDLMDRRVYVGSVISMGEPTETEGADQEIIITPLVSGYRHKDSLKVIYTNDYSKKTSENIELIIKQDQIISATRFSFQVHEDFAKTRPSRKRRTKRPGKGS